MTASMPCARAALDSERGLRLPEGEFMGDIANLNLNIYIYIYIYKSTIAEREREIYIHRYTYS